MTVKNERRFGRFGKNRVALALKINSYHICNEHNSIHTCVKLNFFRSDRRLTDFRKYKEKHVIDIGVMHWYDSVSVQRVISVKGIERWSEPFYLVKLRSD